MDTAPGVTSDAIQARAACETLFLDFHGLIDRGVATNALEVFTDDGVFEVRGEQHQGRNALTRFLRAREAATDRRTRHLASNFRFVLESPTAARATANLTLFRINEDDETLELEAVVDCDLQFICTPTGTWLTSVRRHSRFATAPPTR